MFSVQSGGPFSLLRHHRYLGLGLEPGQALLAEVVTHPLTWVLLLKPKQVQVHVEVDVLSEGVGHRCLWLGVLEAQKSDIPSVWPVPSWPSVFGKGSLRSRCPLSGSLDPAPGAPTAVGTGFGGGV